MASGAVALSRRFSITDGNCMVSHKEKISFNGRLGSEGKEAESTLRGLECARWLTDSNSFKWKVVCWKMKMANSYISPLHISNVHAFSVLIKTSPPSKGQDHNMSQSVTWIRSHKRTPLFPNNAHFQGYTNHKQVLSRRTNNESFCELLFESPVDGKEAGEWMTIHLLVLKVALKRGKSWWSWI